MKTRAERPGLIFSFDLIWVFKGAGFPKEPVPVFGDQVIQNIPDGSWDKLEIFQVMRKAVQQFRNFNGSI
jgi:hypothetical protein